MSAFTSVLEVDGLAFLSWVVVCFASSFLASVFCSDEGWFWEPLFFLAASSADLRDSIASLSALILAFTDSSDSSALILFTSARAFSNALFASSIAFLSASEKFFSFFLISSFISVWVCEADSFASSKACSEEDFLIKPGYIVILLSFLISIISLRDEILSLFENATEPSELMERSL